MKPTLRFESSLIKQGYKYVAGIDEAGRGAWAGPIVAAAVVLDTNQRISGLKDSKLFTPLKRKEYFDWLITKLDVWQIGVLDNAYIDEHGLGQANRDVMTQALEQLDVTPDYVLADGRIFKHDTLPHQNIIKGDQKIATIAAASIIAKVVRDEIMVHYHNQMPHYHFDRHKGYGTQLHLAALQKHGRSHIHRVSFHPMNTL